MEVVVASSSIDAGIGCWDLKTGAEQLRYKTCASSPHGLVCVGGRFLASSQQRDPSAPSGSILYWSWSKPQVDVKSFPSEPIKPLAANSEGTYIVGGGSSGHIYLWEVASGALLKKWHAHYRAVSCLVFSDDDSLLISGADDGSVRVWSLFMIFDQLRRDEASHLYEHSFSEHTLPVTDIVSGYGGCNAIIVSASEDRTCKVWSLSKEKLLRNIVFTSIIYAIALDPGEHVFYAGGRDGKIYIAALNADGSSNNSYGKHIVGLLHDHLCSVHLLSPRLVVRCHCEMITWPTGIGTNLCNFEFYMHVKCAKWLPWYRKSEIAVKYGSRLNVGMLKHKKKMDLVSIHGMIDDDTKEKNAWDSWLELNFFWFSLVYNNLGDKVDFQEVGNRVYSELPENGHIRFYIGNVRSGDDEISVNLNRGGVKGTIMFSKYEVELIGNDLILRMSNAWSKCDKMDIWYYEVVEGLNPMLLAEKVIEESNENFFDAIHGGKEGKTVAYKFINDKFHDLEAPKLWAAGNFIKKQLVWLQHKIWMVAWSYFMADLSSDKLIEIFENKACGVCSWDGSSISFYSMIIEDNDTFKMSAFDTGQFSDMG